jgi:hypothetical protein
MSNNVIAQALGGSKKVLDGVDTVGDVRGKLALEGAYTASINGETAEDGESVDDGDVVTFAKSVKGGSN